MTIRTLTHFFLAAGVLACMFFIQQLAQGLHSPTAVQAAVLPRPNPMVAECVIADAYPDAIRQYCQAIVNHASELALDPNLIAAMILQESGGNAEAVSYSGAVGLMQVMPSDGIAASFQCINGPCFASRPTTQALLEPDFNIDYGTNMLAGLITRTGSIREALKAYGPMDVGYTYADTILQLYADYSG